MRIIGGKNKMATWYDININGQNVLMTPLRPESTTYPDCTPTGTPLTKKQAQKGKYVWLTPDNKEYTGDKCKLVNGQPKKNLKRTKDVKITMTIPKRDVENYDAEAVYYCQVSPQFLKQLQESDEAITFPFTSGNGLKVYKAFLYAHGNSALIRLSRVNITKKIEEIEQGIQAGKALEQLQKELENKDRASEEELLATMDI